MCKVLTKTRWALFVLSLFVLGGLGCAATGKKKTPSKEERAQILVQLAFGTLTDGDPTGALQKLKEAEALDDESSDLYHVRALAYYFKKDFENAISASQKAIQLKPDFSGAKTTLGVILLETGRMNEAIGHLTEAANDGLNREAFKALTALGIIQYKNLNFEKSQEFMTRAINADPVSSCKAYYYRGHIHLKDGNLSKALKDYDHATKMVCGGFADAYLAKGIAYERSKNYEEAKKVFLMVHQRFPKTEIAEQAMTHYRGLP